MSRSSFISVSLSDEQQGVYANYHFESFSRENIDISQMAQELTAKLRKINAVSQTVNRFFFLFSFRSRD